MSHAMIIPAWQRPHWQPSEEEILLQFFVFGRFGEGRPPMQDYGSDGLPHGVTLTSYQHNALRQWEGYPLQGSLGRMLKADVPDAYRAALDAPQVLVVRGRIKDSQATGYLRDTFGVLASLLDTGGVAILDPQIASLFDADAWRRRYLVRDGAPTRAHLLIMRDGDEQPGRSWVHTRGMRKFGRPDVSLRNVPDRDLDRAGALCERLADLQALGAHFVEGQPLEAEGVPGGMVAKLGGGQDDPGFNNTYVEFHWPV
ncbi:hypothetical protein [Dyella sp.]|uniref:hypothetical protein n=1 Tax=Dyella sp. TaxID=1869338 RepID=UPI002ED04A08